MRRTRTTDPFDFYIASEAGRADGFDSFRIDSGEWAIFEGDGDDVMSLILAEMEAFMHWLSSSAFVHDNRPEIEVYPEGTGVYAEFWLPVRKRDNEFMENSLEYRKMVPEEAEKICEIDAECYI